MKNLRTKTNFLAAGMFLVALINGFSQNPTDTLPDAAQKSVTGRPGVTTGRAVVNFSELARQEALGRTNTPLEATESIAAVIGGWAARPPGRLFGANANADAASLQIDTVSGDTQSSHEPILGPRGGEGPSATNSPGPASSFPAFLSDDQFSVPDTHGAVGPNHLVALSNFRLRIQDRSGQVLSTVNVTNFWGPVGPFPCPTCTPGFPSIIWDDKVLYDPFVGRWIITAFAFPNFNDASVLIGVSQTTDPTGSWNLYRIDMDAANLLFFDYPMIGFNKDWIVVQGQMYDASAATVVRSDIYVFNKTNLYAGGAGLYSLFQRPEGAGYWGRLLTPATIYDDSLATMYLVSQVMTNTHTNLSQLRLYTITGPVGAEVFTPGPVITGSNHWDNLSRANDQEFPEFGPQLGSSRKIHILPSVPMSVVYRNGSLWVVQNIFLPAGGNPKRSSLQWWQLTPAGDILQQGLIDDPTGVTFYGHPSLAVNQFNDVLLGYTRFATNIYPSAGYNFRFGTDSLNTMRSDVVYKAGEAPFVRLLNGVNRWGDYSQTCVDPLNDNDLWTIQEYAASRTNNLSRWGLWWARVAPLRVVAIELTGGDVRLSFTTETNKTYRVERTDDLMAPIVWTPVVGAESVAGTGNLVKVSDTGAAIQSQRFYRVTLLP